MSKSRIDELNILAEASEIVRTIEEDTHQYDSIDFLLDLMLYTVISMVENYLEQEYDEAFQTGLGYWLSADPDETARTAAIYAKVDGKTFAERIEEYLSEGLDGFETKLSALLITDGHRVRSEGTLAAGDELQTVGLTVTKTWNSVLDGKERDAHYLLHGQTVPYDGLFEIDGHKAPAPGLFGIAELDCNCRCWLTLNVTE